MDRILQGKLLCYHKQKEVEIKRKNKPKEMVSQLATLQQSSVLLLLTKQWLAHRLGSRCGSTRRPCLPRDSIGTGGASMQIHFPHWSLIRGKNSKSFNPFRQILFRKWTTNANKFLHPSVKWSVQHLFLKTTTITIIICNSFILTGNP